MSLYLAEALVERSGLDPELLDKAIERQVLHGGSLDTNLLEMGETDEEALLQALGDACELPTATAESICCIPEHMPRLFPQQFAESYHLVPSALDGDVLHVLVNGAPDQQLLDRIRERLRLRVQPVITTEVRLHFAMNRLYGTALLPRYQNLLARLDGEAAARSSAAAAAKPQAAPVLLWGVSSARVAPGSLPHQRKPFDARGFLAKADAAQDRDTVVNVLLGAAVSCFDYSAIFLVQNDAVNGWRGIDPESTQRVAQISLPLELPSVFQTVYATGGHYLGPLPNNRGNAALLEGLQRASPRVAFVAPLVVGDVTAAVLYADNGLGTISPRRVAAMLVLVRRCGLALERLIRRRKRGRVAAAPSADSRPAAAPAQAAVEQASSAPPVEADIEVEEPILEANDFEVVAHDGVDDPGLVVTIDADAMFAQEADDELAALDMEVEIESGDEDELSWDDVSFGDIDASPDAEAAAFAVGLSESEAVDEASGDHVAFADIGDSAEESLDDWQDVLEDAAAAAEASSKAAAARERDDASVSVTWEDVAREARSAARWVPRPAVQNIEVAGTVVDHQELLLDGLDATDPDNRRDAVEALLKMGPALDDKLSERFYGTLSFDPLAKNTRLPPFARCNGLLELIAARGDSAAGVVLPHLESDDPRKRFFAIYYLLTVPYPPAVEGLARRLYDTEPRNRHLAADALRRYAREPAYRRVLEGVRAQLKVPVLENQIVAVQVLGQLRDPAAVPSLIPLVAAPQPEMAQAAVSALAVLCAQSFGTDLPAWSQWWQANYNQPRVTWLLQGLRHASSTVRRLANNELQLLTGRTANFEPDASPDAREQAARLWDAWWAQVASGSEETVAAASS